MKQIKLHSIRIRLFTWFLFVSLVPMLVMSSFSYYLIYNKIRNQNEETLTNINRGIYNMVDTQKKVLDEWLQSAAASFQDKLKNLGPSRFDYSEMQEIGGYKLPTWYIGNQRITGDFTLVDHLSEKEKLPASIFQLHDNTFIRVSTNVRQPDGGRITGTLLDITGPVYERVINGQTYLGRANVEGIMHATIYVPIFDEKGKLIGAFVLGRREQEYEMTQAIKNIVVGETGYVFVMDEKGNAIIHPTRQETNLIASQPEVVKEIMQKKNGSITYNFEGREKIAYYTYYEPWNWYIVTGSYTSELFNTTHQLTTILFQAVLIVIAISSLLAYGLSSSFSKPIYELTQVMRKAQGGDLTARFHYTHKDDDFRILSNAFNTMLSTLSIMISRISTNSGKLKDASQRLMSDIIDSKESLKGMEKGVSDLRLESFAGQESSESIPHHNTAVIEEGQQVLYQLELLVDQALAKEQSEQLEQIKLAVEKIKFLYRRLSLTCIDGRDGEKSISSYYSYINKVNSLEVEVEKLKLLLKNINSSAAKLDDIASSLDRQVNIFKIAEEEEEN